MEERKGGGEGRGEALGEVRADAGLLASGNQSAAGAEGESLVQSYAEHGVARLPAADDGLENFVTGMRQRASPVVGDGMSLGNQLLQSAGHATSKCRRL